MGLLRCLTTAAAMKGRPSTNEQAWGVYKAFHRDVRVRLFSEFPAIDQAFRKYSGLAQPAPKLWGDGYVAVHAVSSHAQLITFDQGFRKFGMDCRIL